MTGIVGDLRYGIRALVRNRGFTVVALLSLALGIGANTTIFTLLNAVFLERVLVVFPSVSETTRLPFGVRDLAITIGFLSLFALSRRWFMGRYKPVLNLPHTGGH